MRALRSLRSRRSPAPSACRRPLSLSLSTQAAATAVADHAPSLPNYRRLILESRVYDVARQTPLQPAPSLSAVLQNQVLFKREDLQPVFSFKIRGAYNKMASLSEAQQRAGVVCCSAGNHAQGVALSARKLGVHAMVVMPLATPEIKVEAVRQHGGEFAEIVLHGRSFDEAAAEAKRIEREQGRTMLLPFDDPFVIAGQGTIGVELLQQTSGQRLDAVFVPCGGGGMLAGISAWIKQIRPSVKVIGVEAADSAGMTASLMANERVSLDHVGLFADGTAVKLVGEETFRVCQENVDEMVTVSTDEICAAIKSGFNDTRALLEPSGALAIAGLTQYTQRRGLTGCTFAAVTSGANMDFARLRFVSERADSRERLLSVQIREQPGAFRELHRHVFAAGVRITEFSYRFSDPEHALIYMSFQSRSSTDQSEPVETGVADAAITTLRECGYDVLDLTFNELAKVHTRHLVGGRRSSAVTSRASTSATIDLTLKATKSPVVLKELLYRFEFPSRPGALRTFLEQLGCDWNISVFHYRDHGADVGRVFVGFQVPPEEQHRIRFQSFLDQLGYVHHDETENEMYREWML